MKSVGWEGIQWIHQGEDFLKISSEFNVKLRFNSFLTTDLKKVFFVDVGGGRGSEDTLISLECNVKLDLTYI